MRMDSGLISGQIPSFHQIFHQRVVPGDPGDAFWGDVIGSAVPFVEDNCLVGPRQGCHQGGAHPGALHVHIRAVEDLVIGAGCRPLHPDPVRLVLLS